MSIKTTKRMALGVIASLVFAPLVAVAPASAANSTGTSTVGPVRVSFTGTNQDTVSGAAVTITPDADWTDADTTDNQAILSVALTQAPTAAATLTVAATNYTNQTPADPDLHDTTAQLGDQADLYSLGTDTIATAAASIAGITFKANVSGTYKGNITILGETGGETLTVPFSFTTVGAPASISLSKTAVEFPAVNNQTGTNTITLKDAAGNTTQSSTVDTLSITTTSAANIALTTGASLTDADLKDGTATYTLTSNGTADTETITVTPLGTLPALGVVAVTFTATTVGYGVETAVTTALTSPSSANVVADGTPTADEVAYEVDTSVSTLVFTVSGYIPGAAYKIVLDNTGINSFTVKDNTSNATASTNDANDKTLYGIVGSTGSVVVTVVTTGQADTDTIVVSPNNATADVDEASDALVTFTEASYAVTVSTPAVTPTLSITATPIVIAGKVADTYGNPVSGATVTVTGDITSTVATDTDITGTATTAADGSWSITMPATTTATTSVSLVAAAVKTGLTVTDAAAKVVNFNATGSPATLTWSDGINGANEDSAAGTALDPVTAYPATVVPYTGTVGGATGITDETYTIATAAFSTADTAVENCVALTPTTSPAAQVVFTGSAGVKFTTTACTTAQTVATLKDTVTVASGTAAYAIATKTGANTVTMTSGTVIKSATFYAFNYFDSAAVTNGDSVRNIAVDKASISLKAGEFAVLTISATDAFGNAVKSITAGNGGTVTATASGAAFVEGPSLSKAVSAAWDANGQIMIGVIGSQTPGTGTITIKGTGEQLGAAAGVATGTTAGTNGLTASVASVTVSVTVVGAPEPEPVYEKPTLSFVKDGNRIILSGTAVDGEGDIIIYVKSVGSTTWVEKAKTLEVASPGDFNGSIRAFKKNKVIRVKQEGTGLFSNQIIVTNK